MNLDMTHVTPDLLASLATAQGEIENASKNASNPHFKSKYADLAEVLTTIRETLPKHGLSLTQFPSFDGSLASVTTVVGHSGGGYITATASCVPAKSDAQGIGSATTYLRRYSAAAAAGIAQEDDDGNAAAHNRKPEPVRKNAGKPHDGMDIADMPEERQTIIREHAEVILDWADGGQIDKAAKEWKESTLPQEERIALWGLLPSHHRSAIKRYIDSNKESA